MKVLIVEVDGPGADQLREMLEQSGKFISGEKRFKERFVIKSGNKLQFKSSRDVAYFYADGKVVYLVTKGEGRKYILDHTLEELDRMLDPAFFFRISRKFIICVDSILEVKMLVSGRLELKLNQGCDHDLSVSRERANDFKLWLDR